jgi:hypothetical protein
MFWKKEKEDDEKEEVNVYGEFEIDDRNLSIGQWLDILLKRMDRIEKALGIRPMYRDYRAIEDDDGDNKEYGVIAELDSYSPVVASLMQKLNLKIVWHDEKRERVEIVNMNRKNKQADKRK